jgi:TIR domain
MATKVFISWSGEPSHTVALALREWLPHVIQSIDPYVSSEDIEQGAPWFPLIAQQLDQASFGIICVTRANADSRWMNFEAGALFKSVNSVQRHVSPFLIDLRPTDLGNCSGRGRSW